MGLLDNYKAWAKKTWPWFQTTADKIKAWSLPPGVNEAFEILSAALPKAVAKGLIAYVDYVYKEYGEKKAKKLVEKTVEFLNGD